MTKVTKILSTVELELDTMFVNKCKESGYYGHGSKTSTSYISILLPWLLDMKGLAWIQNVADRRQNGCNRKVFKLAELRFRCDMERDFHIERFFHITIETTF